MKNNADIVSSFKSHKIGCTFEIVMSVFVCISFLLFFGKIIRILTIIAILFLLLGLYLNSRKQKLQVDSAHSISSPVVNDSALVASTSVHEDKVVETISEFNDTLKNIPRFNILIDEEIKSKFPSTDINEITFTSITKTTNTQKLFPLIILDVETTGLKSRGCEIIEVSAIRLEDEFIADSCFTTLLKSKKPIPGEASSINGITDEMVKDSPYFNQICKSFNDYISGCNICGHNLEFDMKFLSANGVEFTKKKTKYFDTLDIAQKFLKKPKYKYDREYEIYERDYDKDYDVEDYKLDTLCDYYHIYRDTSHRSLSDCLATGILFKMLLLDKQTNY